MLMPPYGTAGPTKLVIKYISNAPVAINIQPENIPSAGRDRGLPASTWGQSASCPSSRSACQGKGRPGHEK